MAVFTPVTEADATRFLSEYALGALESLTPIAEGVENTNYKVIIGGAAYALTLFEKRVNVDDLPFYLGLTNHLAAKGYPAPRPATRRDGALFGALNGRPAALVSWLPGAPAMAPTQDEAARGGAALADLHAAAADFPLTSPNRFGPKAWRALADRCQTAAEAPDHAALAADLSVSVDALSADWPSDLPAGAIHGDYFQDNILFEAGMITGVFDYYFACTDAYAYDLAIAVNAWGFTAAGEARADIISAFCAGYQRRRPLKHAEIAAFPTLCAGAATRFTLTRLNDVLHHDPSWLVTPKDPDAFYKRLAFHRAAPGPHAYGLAETAAR